MILIRRWFVAVGMACAFLASVGHAQETVEGRLLKVLKDKGVIGETEYQELTDLEVQLRLADDLSAQIETRIDEMVARLDDESPSTGYKIGKGFTWKTPDGRHLLHLGGRLQVRFTNDFWTRNPATDDENEPDFDVPRARVWLQGNVFEPFLKYKFQFDIAGDEADTDVDVSGTLPNGSTLTSAGSGLSSNRLSEMKDGYFDFTKWEMFSLRGGQFKVPYSRHQLTSSGKQEFVDRAITDRVFAPGRNVGVMIHGKGFGESGDIFEYYAGAFDGEGENKTNNDHGVMWAGRLVVNPFGGLNYSESDLSGHDDFKMAVGFNAWVHQDDNHVGAGDDWSIGGDLAMKWKGFFTTFELHYRENDVDAGADVDIVGWLAQAGYMLVPNEFEVALRYATVDWDDNGTGDSARREYLIVLGYFWHDHNLKTQMDFGRVEDHEGNTADNKDEWRLRIQFQVIF